VCVGFTINTPDKKVWLCVGWKLPQKDVLLICMERLVIVIGRTMGKLAESRAVGRHDLEFRLRRSSARLIKMGPLEDDWVF